MRLSRVAVLLAFVLATAGTLFAQETTGTIKGRIVDAQGLPVPGVTVTATGPQGAKTSTTDADGRYNLPFLTPGTYAVRAELQGFKAIEHGGTTVSLGQTVDIPLKMEVGGITETVNVTGAPTIVDTSSTTTGATISTEFVRNLPVGRRISDVASMAPGVSSSGAVGSANPSISGGTGLDNQYVVDGVNITNQGYGAIGSYSIIFGSLGNATPFDFLQEVQVKTGGYEAEFGQAIGGVVNVITKSGSNDFRGSVFGYTRPQQLEGDWKQFQSENGTVQTLDTQLHDTGAEGGGPIIKNRLFFFGAVDQQWDRRTFQPPQGFPLFRQDGFERKRTNLSYSAKGTLQITSGHRIDASFFGDPSKGEMGPQRVSSLVVTDTSSFSEITYGGHNQTLRYDGVLGSKWLVQAAYARALNRITEVPSVNDWRVRDRTVTPNITTGGIGFYEAGNRSLNNQYLVKSTNIFAGHQVRYGFEYNDVEYSQVNQRTGPTFKTPVGDQTATGANIDILSDPNFGRIYRVVRANLNSSRVTLQKYYSFFAQDTWKVNDRLTINPGVRYEQERLSGTLVDKWELKKNWAPRVGVIFDVFGDSKAKVFGNYGRYYARVPNDLAARALSADAGIGADYFDAQLTRPIPNGTLAGPAGSQTGVHYSIAGAGADVIDPSAKMSYTNEFVVGFEREIFANTSIGVRYTYRNIGRVLEDVANCPMIAYELPQTQGACGSVDYILTNPSSATPVNAAAAFLGVKFDDPVHKYNAIELTLNRRLANNWSAMASYRYSRLRGNFEGFFREDNGQSDPGITSLYDFPTNDPTYSTLGRAFGYQGDIRFLGDKNGILPLDRPHQIKLFGNYTAPMGLSLGVGVRLTSGKPLTPLAANPNANYQNGGEIPEAPRGSGIQTVDGFKTRSPFESQLDLQASYVVRLGSNRGLTFMADVFNLLNQQRTIDYDNWTELTFGVPNPDFGQPISQNVSGPQFQVPRQIRVGLRLGF